VERERDLGALGQRVPSLARLERASSGARVVALEVEGEGLEDERGGVVRGRG
jgi:hypothetical protein